MTYGNKYSFSEDLWLLAEMRSMLENLFNTLIEGEYWFELSFGEEPCTVRQELQDCPDTWRLN